jgi:hypothetical protein
MRSALLDCVSCRAQFAIGICKDRAGAEVGSPRYKHVSVIDLTGFGRKHMGSDFRGPMKEVLDQLQAYYPEVSSRSRNRSSVALAHHRASVLRAVRARGYA